MGQKLTPEEIAILEVGKCPDCGEQLYRVARGGLTENVTCEQEHKFQVAPGFTPERITPKDLVQFRK